MKLPVITGSIGVKDRFGESGAPWELVKEFEVSAEHIAALAMELKRPTSARHGLSGPSRSVAKGELMKLAQRLSRLGTEMA